MDFFLLEDVLQVRIFYAAALFFFGACIGSFLNVVIHRLPREMALHQPPSSCPQCGAGIAAYDNIPILSWFALRGRCRQCREPISWRYPAIELLTACLWAGAGWMDAANDFGRHTNTLILLAHILFLALLVAVATIDFDFQIIPEELSYGGLAGGLLLSALAPPLHAGWVEAYPSVPQWIAGLLGGLVGAVIGAGVMLILTLGGTLAFRAKLKELQRKDKNLTQAIGLGDTKLMALIGAVLGWRGALLSFFLGSCCGAFYGAGTKLATGDWPPAGSAEAEAGGLNALLYRWRTGESIMPYGPFLCLGAGITLYWGEPILGWIVAYYAPLWGGGY